MHDYMNTNQQRWDELVSIHAESEFYDLASLRADKTSLHSLELEELGDVAGKSLLHLQCHFGMDTLSWARLGAQVMGADFSQSAIQFAQALSRELEIEARFVCSNVYDLPQALSEQFDIVFTSYGVLCWLRAVLAAGYPRLGQSRRAFSQARRHLLYRGWTPIQGYLRF